MVLRNLFLVSLFAHFASLAATQTAYGTGFYSMRWYSLFALFGFGFLQWVANRRKLLLSDIIRWRVFIYLGLWGLTVIYAENPLFSGLRWAGHAMIVMSGLIFLPCVLRPKDTWKWLLALKLIVAVTLGYSYFYPVRLTVFDDPTLYRGIFGNPNALGHMSAVGCLLFWHGFLTARDTRWAWLQGAVAVIAGVLMLQSGARSSIMAFLAGLTVLYVFYKANMSRYSMLAAVAAAFALLVVPDLWERASTFIFKHGGKAPSDALMDRLLFTRQSGWEQHWNGFLQRPLLGWGFGADRDANFSNWQGAWRSTGVVGRDPVNDVMYSLESGGLVGLLAYLFVITLIIKGWFTARVRAVLDFRFRQRDIGPMGQVYDAYRIFFCLCIALITVFEFDNTAMAAGNFFAALMWISMGMALGFYAMIATALQRPGAEPAKPLTFPRPTLVRPQ